MKERSPFRLSQSSFLPSFFSYSGPSPVSIPLVVFEAFFPPFVEFFLQSQMNALVCFQVSSFNIHPLIFFSLCLPSSYWHLQSSAFLRPTTLNRPINRPCLIINSLSPFNLETGNSLHSFLHLFSRQWTFSSFFPPSKIPFEAFPFSCLRHPRSFCWTRSSRHTFFLPLTLLGPQ